MTFHPFHIQGIGQVSIPVRQLDSAVSFYRDTLGLTLLFQVSGMAFFDCGGIRILVSVPEGPEFEHRSSVFYFRTADIQAAYETLLSRGTEMVGPPHKVAEMNGTATWMVFFKDPDGNTHALMSEVPC